MTDHAASDHADGISHTKSWRDFSLAAHARSLDPSSKTNRYLVEQRRMGSVPKVIAINEAERWASVELPAVSATVKVPLGWHVLDDGNRSLIFDPDGAVQVNFSLVPAEGRDVDQLIEQTKQQALAGQPERPTLVQQIGAMKLLAVADLQIEGETLDVCWMYTMAPVADELFLQVRVTASKDRMTGAMDLFELLMTEFTFLVQRVDG
jgi:hypothetical protein